MEAADWLMTISLVLLVTMPFWVELIVAPKRPLISLEIIKLYKSLPKEYRPDEDIIARVKELDKKFDKHEVNKAFEVTTIMNFTKMHPEAQSAQSSKFYIYYAIFKELENTHAAVKKLNNRLEEKALEPVKESNNDLINRLREHRQVISEVADEI